MLEMQKYLQWTQLEPKMLDTEALFIISTQWGPHVFNYVKEYMSIQKSAHS
jgi:hypothetical protein